MSINTIVGLFDGWLVFFEKGNQRWLFDFHHQSAINIFFCFCFIFLDDDDENTGT